MLGGLWRIGWWCHADTVVPVGGQTNFDRAEEVVWRARDKQASTARQMKLVESHLVWPRIRLVIAGPLRGHNDVKVDAGACNGLRSELLGAVGDDPQRHAIMAQSAEHFANFFMDNMPAYAIGMADAYEGPIEDPKEVRPALLRALEQVKQGRPALVDTITRHR